MGPGPAGRGGRDNGGMLAPICHRIVNADVHTVPKPFAAFAVRSDEPRHAYAARAPYGRVHHLQVTCVDAASLAGLARQGYARVRIGTCLDIDHADTTPADLAVAAPHAVPLAERIAAALQITGVLGPDASDYRRSVATRIDYLASRGAGFHNDVSGHWSRCLFWVLALDVADAEFVMPHAALRLPLVPGDLLVFDPTMAHGLCRPQDAGQAVAASFGPGDDGRQIFLTGELRLTDAHWAALGAPWLPVEQHERRSALDLMVAEFDERTGAIKRPAALRGGMQRSTCHVDRAAQ